MGPEIISLIGGFTFLPGPLERSSTVSPLLRQFEITCVFVGPVQCTWNSQFHAFFCKSVQKRDIHTDGRTQPLQSCEDSYKTLLKQELLMFFNKIALLPIHIQHGVGGAEEAAPTTLSEICQDPQNWLCGGREYWGGSYHCSCCCCCCCYHYHYFCLIQMRWNLVIVVVLMLLLLSLISR